MCKTIAEIAACNRKDAGLTVNQLDDDKIKSWSDVQLKASSLQWVISRATSGKAENPYIFIILPDCWLWGYNKVIRLKELDGFEWEVDPYVSELGSLFDPKKFKPTDYNPTLTDLQEGQEALDTFIEFNGII